MGTKKYRLKRSKSKRYRKKAKGTRKQRGGCINGQCMIGGTKVKPCGSEYNSI
jgi:hypothetical protein